MHFYFFYTWINFVYSCSFSNIYFLIFLRCFVNTCPSGVISFLPTSRSYVSLSFNDVPTFLPFLDITSAVFKTSSVSFTTGSTLYSVLACLASIFLFFLNASWKYFKLQSYLLFSFLLLYQMFLEPCLLRASLSISFLGINFFYFQSFVSIYFYSLRTWISFRFNFSSSRISFPVFLRFFINTSAFSSIPDSCASETLSLKGVFAISLSLSLRYNVCSF